MTDTRIIRVEKKPGLLLGGVWVPKGKTALVDKVRAEQLIRDKDCTAADDAEPDFADLYPEPTDKQRAANEAAALAALNTPASQLIDWPAYMKLNAGGLTTVGQLQLYKEENGTLWSTKLDLTDDEVVEIEAELKKLAKPAGKGKAKETPPAKPEPAEPGTADEE